MSLSLLKERIMNRRAQSTAISELAARMNADLIKLVPQLRDDLIVFGCCAVTLENNEITRADPATFRIVR